MGIGSIDSTLWSRRTPVISSSRSSTSPIAPSTSRSQHSSKTSPGISVTWKNRGSESLFRGLQTPSAPLRIDHSDPVLLAGSSHSGRIPSLNTAKESTDRSTNFFLLKPSNSTLLLPAHSEQQSKPIHNSQYAVDAVQSRMQPCQPTNQPASQSDRKLGNCPVIAHLGLGMLFQ